MTAVSVTVLPPQKTLQPVPRESFAAALTIARAQITPMMSPPAPPGPEIEGGFWTLDRLVTNVCGFNVGQPEYRAGEALAAVKTVQDTAANEASWARREISRLDSAIEDLGVIRPAADVNEGQLDREIRDRFLSMTDKRRLEQLAELRQGEKPLVLRALARSPLPSELEQECVRIFATTSHAVRREALTVQRDFETWKLAAAGKLAVAGDAVKEVVALFIQAAAAHREDESTEHSRPVVHRTGEVGGATTEALQPPAAQRATVAHEGPVSITRVG